MKTILTTAILIFALSFYCSAQQTVVVQGGGQRHQMTPEEQAQMLATAAQRQTAQMKERLNLDEEQEKAIGEINLKYARLRNGIIELARTQEGVDLVVLMQELEEKRDNEILPFLNNDQIDTYTAFRKEQQVRVQQMQQRRDDVQRERGGQGGRQRPAR